MEAIVLAGGLGKRLRAAISDLPKPMAPVNERPFLAYVLSFLRGQGVDRVVLATGYLHHKIEEFFGACYQDVKIDYSVEEEPLGTGGGLQLAFSKLREKSVVIVNGDTFFEVDLKEMNRRHSDDGADLTIALKPMKDIERYGVVKFANGKITKFEEKKQVASGHINAGIYVAKSDLFAGFDLGEKFSFEEDLLKPYIATLRVCPFISDGFFIDIGVPEDYQRAQHEMKNMNKALFLDRDGVINKEINYLYRPEDFEFIDGIFELCQAFLAKGYRIFVVTNQAGIARGFYTEEDFNVLTEWMLGQFKKRKIEISKVYFCPFHTEAVIEKYKRESADRKPNPGMILKARDEFDLDLQGSYLIGDKESDIEAGQVAGVGGNILMAALTSNTTSSKADFVIHSLHDLQPLLNF